MPTAISRTRSLFWTTVLFLTIVLSACSKKEGPLFATACEGDNLNCKDSSISFSTNGATSDISATAMNSGDTSESVAIPAARYAQKKTVEYSFTNRRLIPLSGLTTTLSPGGSGYVVETDHATSCATVGRIYYSQSCSVKISFTPGTVPADQAITFTFKTLLGADVIFKSSISGAAIVSDYYIPASELSFPDLLIYDPADPGYFERDLTVSNYGTQGDLLNYQISTSGSTDYTIVAPGAGYCTAGQTLTGNGGSCKIKVRFKPETTGTKTFTITLTGTGGISNSYDLTGTGSAMSASVSSIAFGAREASSAPVTSVVTLTNPSTYLDPAATSCTYTTTGDPEFSVSGTTCAASVAASATCTVTVQYTPAATTVAHTGNLTSTCDSRGGNLTIPLTGSSVIVPDISWAAAPSPAFGEQDIDGGALSRTFTLQNNDATPVTLTGLSFSVASAGFTISSAAGTTCTSTTTLAATGTAGDTCDVIILFDPVTDTTGSGGEAATLKAQGTSPIAFSADLALTGTGTTMSISTSPSSLSFTPREIGQAGSETKTCTLTNNGTRTANLTYSALTNPPFSRAGTCGATLASGASCTLAISASAAAAAATHSATLTVTDTLNGNTKTATCALSGETITAPSLGIIDDVGNSVYATTIATSDITGATDAANNIIDLTPSTRDVTFTLKNTVLTSGTLGSIGLTLTYSSGTNNTMSLVSDNCTSTTLTGGATCTFKVRYTPTTNNQTSSYTLTAASSSTSSGVAHNATVTTIIAHSIRGATLTISTSPIDIPIIVSSTTTQSSTYTITNTGDQTASSLTYNITGTDSANFSNDGTVGSACGATLAGQATCSIRVNFDPSSVAGAFTANYVIAGAQTGDSLTTKIRAASYDELALGNDSDGIEGDITADTSRFYLVSRMSAGGGAYKPLLTVCSKTAKGALDSSTCIRNDIVSILGGAVGSNMAGNLAGSGPRVAQNTNKILMALQNKDVALGGEAAGGTSTVVVCQKPAAGNTVTSCNHFVVNSDAQSGQFPSIAVTSSKVSVANSAVNKNLVITTCTYTSSTSTTDSTTLDTSSCVKQDFAGSNEGWYPSISFTGTQVVVASYDRVSTPYGLRLSGCTVASNNTYSDCTSSVADNTTLADAPDTLYSGAYPSVLLDGTTVYAAYQLGETIKMRPRLSKCTISSANVVSACVNQNVSNTSGKGATPRLTMSGSGSSGNLWISTVNYADPSDNASAANLDVYKCALPITAGSCTAVSSYLTQSTKGFGVIYSHSTYLDTTNKLLLAPFDAFFGAHTDKNGFMNIGLWPEL